MTNEMTSEFEAAWAKRPWETESRTDKDRAWFWWQASCSSANAELIDLLRQSSVWLHFIVNGDTSDTNSQNAGVLAAEIDAMLAKVRQ